MKLFKTRMAAQVLGGVVLVLGTSAAQSVMAHGQDEDGAYTNASLQGSYAYVNNSGDVASFGPMTFNGHREVTLTIKVSLPCDIPSPGCSRGASNLKGTGTYTVEKDGTGSAQITFDPATNPLITTYDFVISGTTKKGRTLLATEVFAVSENGGLAGQKVAPTWSRTGD